MGSHTTLSTGSIGGCARSMVAAPNLSRSLNSTGEGSISADASLGVRDLPRPVGSKGTSSSGTSGLSCTDRMMKCLEVTRVNRLARQWNIISFSCAVDPCDEHGMLVARAGAGREAERAVRGRDRELTPCPLLGATIGFHRRRPLLHSINSRQKMG